MASQFAQGQQLNTLLNSGDFAGGLGAIGSKSSELMADFAGFHGALAQGDIELARGRVQTSNALLSQASAEINADLARFDARQTVRFGKQASARLQSRARLVRGAQRTRAAAGGVDVSTGSAAQVEDQIQLVGELDAITMELNAARQASGLEMQAFGFEQQAAAAGFFGEESRRAAQARASQAKFGAGIALAGMFGRMAGFAGGAASG